MKNPTGPSKNQNQLHNKKRKKKMKKVKNLE